MNILFIILWSLIWIAIILFSITIHEFGHFLALKKMNVYVHEFSIGFGPALFSWGKNETRYFVRLLPLGGYVIGASKLSKDLFEDVDVPKDRLIDALKFHKKLFFVFAGIGMNFLFALLISLAYFAVKDHYSHAIHNYGSFLLNTISQFFLSMKALFSGHAGSISQNISVASNYTFGQGAAYIIFLITFINFNLGIFNVIPFPPLDGWKGAEFTYEKITKKEISEKAKIIVTLIGVVCLLSLTIFSFAAPYIY